MCKHNLATDYLKIEAHFDCFSSCVLLKHTIFDYREKHKFSWAVCLVSFFAAICFKLLFRGREIELNFIVSLSTSFRYKDCDKQESHEGDCGVDQEGDLTWGRVIEVGVGEGRDERQNTDPANRQPGKTSYVRLILSHVTVFTRLYRF